MTYRLFKTQIRPQPGWRLYTDEGIYDVVEDHGDHFLLRFVETRQESLVSLRELRDWHMAFTSEEYDRDVAEREATYAAEQARLPQPRWHVGDFLYTDQGILGIEDTRAGHPPRYAFRSTDEPAAAYETQLLEWHAALTQEEHERLVDEDQVDPWEGMDVPSRSLALSEQLVALTERQTVALERLTTALEAIATQQFGWEPA